MRLQSKPVFITGIIVMGIIFVVGGLYTYLSFNARSIFNFQVSQLSQRKVDARLVRAEFPAGLLVEGLSIEGVLTCERVHVSVDALSLLARIVRINSLELNRPVILWEKSASDEATAKGSPADNAQGRSAGRAASTSSVILDRLVVRDGVLKVTVTEAKGAAREYVVEHIQLDATKVPLTDTPVRTEFSFNASLARLNVPFVGQFLKGSGWLNWAARDMDAVVQAIDDDGRIGLDAKFAARQNDMTVFGTVKLAADQGPQASGQKAGLAENVVLGLLAATRTDIEAGFSFKTMMDKFEMGSVSLSGQITTGLNSSATSGNIVAGLKAVGEELLKAPDEE